MDRGSADLTAEAELWGFDGPDDKSADRRHGRRALWLSIGLIVVLIAVTAVVIAHLAKPKPGSVAAATRVAGLTLDQQSNASDTAEYLRNAVAAGMNLHSSVGAVYSDGTGDSHSVIFIGGTTTAGSSSARLKSLFGLLDDGTDGVAHLTHEQAGKLGGLVDCAATTESNLGDATTPNAMAACGWADGDTVGLALFPNRSISEAAGLFGQMRSALETH